MLIKKIDDLNIDFDTIQISDFWTCNDTKDSKMHRIHWYPAKFPAFLVEKSLKYAKDQNIEINNVVDFFCGCGTTPLETKRLGYNFWGCDINPVATLIARVKSNKYNETSLNRYFNKITTSYKLGKIKTPVSYIENERLNYWFPEKQIKKLYKLLYCIKKEVPQGKYRDFFLCILQATA